MMPAPPTTHFHLFLDNLCIYSFTALHSCLQFPLIFMFISSSFRLLACPLASPRQRRTEIKLHFFCVSFFFLSHGEKTNIPNLPRSSSALCRERMSSKRALKSCTVSPGHPATVRQGSTEHFRNYRSRQTQKVQTGSGGGRGRSHKGSHFSV